MKDWWGVELGTASARSSLLFVLAVLLLLNRATAQVEMEVRVDLTDGPRHLLHVTETLPAHMGVNSFRYPKWIPGQHLPGGPVDNLTGLAFHANSPVGFTLAWRHDLVDPYTVNVIAPPSVASIYAEFDFLDVPSHANTTATRRTSSHVIMLEPSDVVLYPAMVPVRDITVRATVKLPDHWSGASALEMPGPTAPALFQGNVRFSGVSLEQFVDSPIVAGDHCRQYVLAVEVNPRHTLDVCAESDSALKLPATLIDHMSNLVRESTQVFRSHHYAHYDFLLALSPHLEGDSLEHTQSADYVVKAAELKDDSAAELVSYLIPHEFVHSWCGKYRRPARMATPDYQTPQQDDLLWVYEGLTEYYGDVLATRAGFRTPAQTLDILNFAVYNVDQPGRRWRSVQDTADVAPILRNSDSAWSSWRRDQDYYREGALLWLEADMRIRTLTHDRRSLDDFAGLFLGASAPGRNGDTGPGLLPYEFPDVVWALNEVAPFDWAAFWMKRLNTLVATPPTAGLDQAGYSYLIRDSMSESEADYVKASKFSDMLRSLGFFVLTDGTLRDVWMHSPAFVAGLGPGDKLTAVNGTPYTPDILAKAVRDAKLHPGPIVLTAIRDDETQTFQIDYHEGEKYSVLERNEKPDTLTTRILLPRSMAPGP